VQIVVFATRMVLHIVTTMVVNKATSTRVLTNHVMVSRRFFKGTSGKKLELL